MVLVKDTFALPNPGRDRVEAIFNRYADTYDAISVKIAALPDSAPESNTLKAAALRVASTFPDWRTAIASARAVQNTDPHEASRIYAEALNSFPEVLEVIVDYARFVSFIANDAASGEVLYRKALALAPNRLSALNGLASLLARDPQRLDDAALLCEQAIEVAPIDSTAYGELGDIRSRQGRADLAAAVFEKGLRFRDNHSLLFNYALFEQRRGDDAKADRLYKRLLTDQPTDINARANYAGMLLSCGRLEEGRVQLGLVMNSAEFAERRAVNNDRTALVVECYFYDYAHLDTSSESASALAQLKKLIDSGRISRDWDLTANAKRARSDGHPEPDGLDVLASVISGTVEASALAEWQTWRDLPSGP